MTFPLDSVDYFYRFAPPMGLVALESIIGIESLLSMDEPVLEGKVP
jgi:hypothetical protein